jgi:hypothetical protein
MKDTSIVRTSGCHEVSGVHALDDVNTWVASQPDVELPSTHVQGDDPSRTALQQTIDEAAGRGPDIQGGPAHHVECESVEGRIEFVPAPRDEARPFLYRHGNVRVYEGP